MITIFSILPALFYVFIIYLSTPHKTINTKMIHQYLLGGVFSGLIVLFSGLFFPNFYEPLFLDYKITVYTPEGFVFGRTMLTEFINAFFQIALVEELSKFILFYIICNFFCEGKRTNYISMMFNCVLVSAGFAIIENIIYSIRLAHIVGDVLLVRSFTAVVTHISCGAIMGYFISRGRERSLYNNNSSEFFTWMNTNRRYKSAVYTTIGIILAVAFHGLYDFNISMGSNHTELLTILGLVVSYLLFKDLKKKKQILN